MGLVKGTVWIATASERSTFDHVTASASPTCSTAALTSAFYAPHSSSPSSSPSQNPSSPHLKLTSNDMWIAPICPISHADAASARLPDSCHTKPSCTTCATVALFGIHVLPDLHLTMYRMIQDSFVRSFILPLF